MVFVDVKEKRQKLVKHKRDAEALAVYMLEPFSVTSSPSDTMQTDETAKNVIFTERNVLQQDRGE